MLTRYFDKKYRVQACVKSLSAQVLDQNGGSSLAAIASRVAQSCAPEVSLSVFHDSFLRGDIARMLLPQAGKAKDHADKIASFSVPKRFLKPPQHLTERPACFFDGRLYASEWMVSVYSVVGGYVGRIGDAPVIWASDGVTILADCSSRFAPMLVLSGCNILDVLAQALVLEGDLLVLLGDYQSENYCHWLLDEMPRLGLVPKQKNLYIAVRPLKHSFQFELLRRWGIAPQQLVMLDDFSAVRAQRLIIFDHVADNTAPAHHAAEWMLAPVQAHLPPTKIGTDRKIYLARDDARGRRIVNADAFETLLADIGYKKYVPGKMSCQEQINLFAGAERIIAPHGAALANLVFCRHLEQLLEIFPPDYGTPFAHVLADAVGAHYMTFCTREKIPGPRAQQDDISIDLAAWQATTSGLL